MQALEQPLSGSAGIEELQSRVRSICGHFNLNPATANDRGGGSIQKKEAARFEVACVDLEDVVVTRDLQAIRQDPSEHFFLLIQNSGRCRITQGGHTVVLTSGDMFLVDAARPSEFVYGNEMSGQLSVHLPREEMSGRFGQACNGGIALSRSDPLWLAMGAVFAKMFAASGPQTELREAVFSLFGAYLSSLAGGDRADSSGAFVSKALAMIDRHRADPSFGPRELAARLNVSERTLQRHFKVLGETPGRRLLERRLDLAYARLTAGASCRGENVTSIALDCGFNDLSYFHREFRRKYGATPGVVARRH